MVTRIISGQSIRGLLLYNENKVTGNEANLIMASRFGTELNRLDFDAKLARFEHLTFLKPNVKTNAIHIILNFDRDDKLDLVTFQQLAASYMDRIGFGEQPYLVYQHQDASHPHLHIVTTNINAQGERMDIHGIGRTASETARKELEIEYNLIKAEGRQKSEALPKGKIIGDHQHIGRI
ncbi:relaxase/mobilization nuclease domain-containing protein [Sphingobacterium spiritivorum]|uniref:relaxase/mobilization nuclease domain-containing protein n=1 Tax=Sphingobacterium spiritivorum TaxID=258 RepID=UPI00191AE4DD|nr:relaxase/mobilization nuclease domain-containing protein [Sphingobacterium spiritivorum]QQT24496.1 relaxase/mobilization nuclease domain-containing protein [Sphingobacterium spiritivorum]